MMRTSPAQIATTFIAAVLLVGAIGWLAVGLFGGMFLALWLTSAIAAGFIWSGFKSATRDHDDPDYGSAA